MLKLLFVVHVVVCHLLVPLEGYIVGAQEQTLFTTHAALFIVSFVVFWTCVESEPTPRDGAFLFLLYLVVVPLSGWLGTGGVTYYDAFGVVIATMQTLATALVLTLLLCFACGESEEYDGWELP